MTLRVTVILFFIFFFLLLKTTRAKISCQTENSLPPSTRPTHSPRANLPFCHEIPLGFFFSSSVQALRN